MTIFDVSYRWSTRHQNEDLVTDQHHFHKKIYLVIDLLLTSTSTRWNSRATGAMELSSNNLRRPRTLMGFHIRRLGDNPFRAFDEILMQRCVGLYISRCPTTMTNSKSPLMQRTTSEISYEKKMCLLTDFFSVLRSLMSKLRVQPLS